MAAFNEAIRSISDFSRRLAREGASASTLSAVNRASHSNVQDNLVGLWADRLELPVSTLHDAGFASKPVMNRPFGFFDSLAPARIGADPAFEPKRYLATRLLLHRVPMAPEVRYRAIKAGDPYGEYQRRKEFQSMLDRPNPNPLAVWRRNFEAALLASDPARRVLPTYTTWPESPVWTSIGRPRPKANGWVKKTLLAAAEMPPTPSRRDFAYMAGRWFQPGWATACALSVKLLGHLPEGIVALCISAAVATGVSILVGAAGIFINPFLMMSYARHKNKDASAHLWRELATIKRQAFEQLWPAIKEAEGWEDDGIEALVIKMRLGKPLLTASWRAHNGLPTESFQIETSLPMGTVQCAPLDPDIALRYGFMDDIALAYWYANSFVRLDTLASKWVRWMVDPLDLHQSSFGSDLLAATKACRKRNDRYHAAPDIASIMQQHRADEQLRRVRVTNEASAEVPAASTSI